MLERQVGEVRIGIGRAVAQIQPQDPDRIAVEDAQVIEVGVLRDEDHLHDLGVAEDDAIWGRLHPELANMLRTGVDGSEALDEMVRKILVEEQSQPTAMACWRSRSAAYAKAARMSSRCKSGKSARI